MRPTYEEPKKPRNIFEKIWQHWAWRYLLLSFLITSYIWFAANAFWVAVPTGAALLILNETFW